MAFLFPLIEEILTTNSFIFSYNALAKFVENIGDDNLKNIFKITNTTNFEIIMQQLDSFQKLAIVFGAEIDFIEKINRVSETLRTSLISAIKEMHPGHVFTIPEQSSQACSVFLNTFLQDGGNIFTTNYDLLLYWVLMRNNIKFSNDGFGRESEENDEYIPINERTYSELRWGKYKKSQTISIPVSNKGNAPCR